MRLALVLALVACSPTSSRTSPTSSRSFALGDGAAEPIACMTHGDHFESCRDKRGTTWICHNPGIFADCMRWSQISAAWHLAETP